MIEPAPLDQALELIDAYATGERSLEDLSTDAELRHVVDALDPLMQSLLAQTLGYILAAGPDDDEHDGLAEFAAWARTAAS